MSPRKYNSNHSSVYEETEKSPEDLKRLPVTQYPEITFKYMR